jgi:DNA-binding SARP family transcriptional activator
MTRTTRIARAAQAAVALVLLGTLVVGIPWALVHYIGSPFPHQIPGWQQIRATLTQQGIPDDFLLKLLAIVVWITWAPLVASLVSEAIGTLRGKTTRTLPLTSPFQPVARWLVAAIAVGILTTTTRTTATPQPALAASLTALYANAPPAELVVDVTAPPPAVLPVPSNGAAAPADAPQPAVYVVVGGDTLWDIAQQHLGDPYRWPEIYDLNRGQPQLDGTVLTDPNLIYPGWNLQLPTATPTAAALAPVPTPAPPPAPAPTAPIELPPSSVATNGSTGVTTPSTTPATAPAPRSAERDQTRTATSETKTSSTIPFGVAGTVLLASGSLGLLTLLRRRQLQRRKVGRALPRLSNELAATEIALRTAADGSPGPWLDLALRALAAQLRIQPGQSFPRPIAAHLTPDELVITLAEPNTSAPKPWSTRPPGWKWHLPAAISTAELERLAANTCAPLPALSSIGDSPDGPVMIDLEACGVVTITGPPDEARGLARSAALELAVSPVADELDIILVGANPLIAPSPTHGRVRQVRTIDDAVALIARLAEATGRGLDDAALATTFAARCANHGSDPWTPTILIIDIAPTERERERLTELAATGGRGIGILAIGDWNDAAWNLHVTDGTIDVPRLGIHGLTAPIEAQRVEHSVANATVQLFAHADDDTDELLLQFDRVDARTGAEEPVPDAVDAAIVVHVFGDVRVDGAMRALTDTENELVAFVATRDHPVNADIVQTALWPDRAVSPKRWWNLISDTRKALGVDSDGEFYLPPLAKGQALQLAVGVTTDLARIETALRRFRSDESAEGIHALASALDGVTGRPFDAKRGYAWVHANGLASYAEALVVDAAHELAALYLDRGKTDDAIRVITTGLHASPGNEILYRVLILAHGRVGDARAAENAMRDLLETLEATDPYSDLQPATVDAYERACGRIPSESLARASDSWLRQQAQARD